jgi:hypothetical protein
MLFRIPNIQPIGAVIRIASAGRTLWRAASWMKGQFQPGLTPPP